MPVETREKLRAVTGDLGSQAEVARLLGVSRSRVSRWLRNEDPDPANQRMVHSIEYVVGRLLTIYERDTALKWLRGTNAHLGGRRPVDLLAAGRVVEIIGALEAEETGAYA